jgi:hypothetical protein
MRAFLRAFFSTKNNNKGLWRQYRKRAKSEKRRGGVQLQYSPAMCHERRGKK